MWYDGFYANDLSTDNIFGLEALAERQAPVLLEYLRRGGGLAALAREPGRDLMAMLDRALAGVAFH